MGDLYSTGIRTAATQKGRGGWETMPDLAVKGFSALQVLIRKDQGASETTMRERLRAVTQRKRSDMKKGSPGVLKMTFFAESKARTSSISILNNRDAKT